MRKASMTQEWREQLTAALPSEHFGMNDVKRFCEIFPELPINEHGESDGQLTTAEKRQRWILVKRVRDEKTHRTHVDAAVLSRLSRVERHGMR